MNRWWGWTAVVVVLVVLGASCSGDDDAGPATTQTTVTSTTSATVPESTTSDVTTSTSTSTSSTEPPGTDPVALEPVLQGLLDRYDAAVAAILADPKVASDPSHPAVRAYLDLFIPGSEFAQGALASWVQAGEQGRFYRPGPRGELIDTTIRVLTGSSENEATFSACAVNSIEIVDAAGNLIESQGGVTFVEVVAIRNNGVWVLRDLTQSAGDCPRPGTNE